MLPSVFRHLWMVRLLRGQVRTVHLGGKQVSNVSIALIFVSVQLLWGWKPFNITHGSFRLIILIGR